MVIPYGRRTARIKKYINNHEHCQSCGAFDLDVKVYNDYYHIFFIPVFPIENKAVKIRCRNCGNFFRSDSLQRHYENISKTPIYFYTISVIFAGLMLILAIANWRTQKEKAAYVAKPQVGDIYTINKKENNSNIYYFLRLASIKGDTVIAYQNNLKYDSFTSTFAENDFFVKDNELLFLKPKLKQMLEKAEIIAVDRDYNEDEGFNRIK